MARVLVGDRSGKDSTIIRHSSPNETAQFSAACSPVTVDENGAPADCLMSAKRLLLLYLQHTTPLYLPICSIRHRRKLPTLAPIGVVMFLMTVLISLPILRWASGIGFSAATAVPLSLTESLGPLLMLLATIGLSSNVDISTRLHTKATNIATEFTLCAATTKGMYYAEAKAWLRSGLATSSRHTLDMVSSYHEGMVLNGKLQMAMRNGREDSATTTIRHLPSIVQRISGISRHGDPQLGRLGMNIVTKALRHGTSTWAMLGAGAAAFVLFGLPLTWLVTRVVEVGCDGDVNCARVEIGCATAALVVNTVLAVVAAWHHGSSLSDRPTAAATTVKRVPIPKPMQMWRAVMMLVFFAAYITIFAVGPSGVVAENSVSTHFMTMAAVATLWSWILGAINKMHVTIAGLKHLEECLLQDEFEGRPAQTEEAHSKRFASLDPRNPDHIHFIIEMRKVIETIGRYQMSGPAGIVLTASVVLAAGLFAVLLGSVLVPTAFSRLTFAQAPYFMAAASVGGLAAVMIVLVLISAAASVNSAQADFTKVLASVVAQVEVWQLQAERAAADPADPAAAPDDAVQETKGDEVQVTKGDEVQVTKGDEVQETKGDDQETKGDDHETKGGASGEEAEAAAQVEGPPNDIDIKLVDADGKELQYHRLMARSGYAEWKVEVQGDDWMVGLAHAKKVHVNSRGIAKVQGTLAEATASQGGGGQTSVTATFTQTRQHIKVSVGSSHWSISRPFAYPHIMLVTRGATNISVTTSADPGSIPRALRTKCVGTPQLLLRPEPSIHANVIASTPAAGNVDVTMMRRDSYGMAWVAVATGQGDEVLWTSASPGFMTQIPDEDTALAQLPEPVPAHLIARSASLLRAAVMDAQMSPLQLKLLGLTMDAKLRAALVTALLSLASLVLQSG